MLTEVFAVVSGYKPTCFILLNLSANKK